MTKRKIIIALFTFIILPIILVCIFSAGAKNSLNVNAETQSSYSFNEVDININVREDKTLAVRESLTAVWDNSTKRSLIRDIQKISATTRIIDGKKLKGKDYFAKISDISVTLDGGECDWHIIGSDDSFYLKEFFSIEMMRPNGANLTAGVPYNFVLEYVYDMSDDKVKGFDDFTYDVLGYEMAEVKKLTASITFDKPTESLDVSLRTNGKRDWAPNPDVGEYVNIGENKIEICAFDREENAGLTVQTLLPDGYFKVTLTFYWYYVIFAAIAIAAVIAGIWLFFNAASSEKPVVTAEFYPPEGVDIMEFSSVWHRGAKSKDAAAIILKWAESGFIKIEKDGKKDFILYTTGKKPDDIDERGRMYCETNAEQNFYNQLFMFGLGGANKFSTRKYRHTSSKNKTKFYESVEKLVKNGDKYKISKSKAEKMRCALPFLALVPTLSVMVYFSIVSLDAMAAFFSVFLAAGTLMGVIFRKMPSVLILLFPLCFYGVVYFMYLFIFAMPLYDYAYLHLIAPSWWALNVFVLPFCIKDKRTENANNIYGKILGFKQFLLKAELPRIQLLFDENPDYFADILPYCYILGISKKVQKRFASLDFKVPQFIDDGIDAYLLCSNFTRSSLHAPFTMAGVAGGFSGGGGGGGHGGSSGGGGGGGGSRSR